MYNLANRKLKIIFRQKSNVFFSLMGVFIIIGLYALFLGDVWTSGFGDIEGVEPMMGSWIMSGVIPVTSITTTMGAFGTMVEDKTDKIMKDFNAAPIKRWKIAGGYLLSSYIIGVIFSMVALVLGELYIVSCGGEILGFGTMVKVIGVILLSVLASSSMVFFLVSFFTSNNAFATASTVLGTLIGFLTGIYLPIGQLPETVQWVIKCFPVSHAAVLLRQLFMENPVDKVFAGAPVESVSEFKDLMGIQFYYGDYLGTTALHVGVLVITSVVFFILAVINVSRVPKK
jgi:multidrug/hemolysin transport system permease protein